jgi:hypothetical protein
MRYEYSEVITEDMIKKAHSGFESDRWVEAGVIPTPTRTFSVGDECRVGALEECIIAEVLRDGKAYRINYVSKDNNYGRPTYEPMTRIWWWFDVYESRSDDFPVELFSPYLPGQVQQSDISSIIHMMSFGGLVCDPRYQRGYVWTEDDQVALIDSIFNRMNIGSLIFSRHHGYLHKGQIKTVTYVNFDGDEVTINREKDYTSAVIDGQQRATTIWRFVTNQFKYKGLYYKDLHPRDRGEFNSTLVSFRLFDEDSVPYKDVLRMFINVNRGVPQDAKHLEKVINQLEALENE